MCGCLRACPSLCAVLVCVGAVLVCVGVLVLVGDCVGVCV